jgi:hypothetical protein
MEVEKRPLSRSKSADIHDRSGLNAHSLQRRTVSHWRDNQGSVVLEADEASIKEMIDARRKQEAVLTIESFFIGRVSPRLAMTCDKMNEVLDSGNSTPSFNHPNSILKDSLSATRSDDRLSLGIGQRNVVLYLSLKPLFPDIEIIRDLGMEPCVNRL